MMLCSSRLKQGLSAIFLLVAFFIGGAVHAQDSSRSSTTSDGKIRNIDGVAAVVNTGYVTRKEIDDRITALQKQGVKLPDGPDLRKLVLERLVLEKIQLQNASQEGISVTNKELEKIIGDIAAKNKLTYQEFKAKVIASGMSFERYKENLRDDVVVSRYRERSVESKIKISDAEIDNFIADRNRDYDQQ